MSMTVNFRGGETAGGVSDRRIDTTRHETAGGVGARGMQNSIFVTDEPKCDVVCFRSTEYAYAEPKKKTSLTSIILGSAALTAIVIGLLGLAHKYNLASRYMNSCSNKYYQKFMTFSTKITEPCFNVCKWLKNNTYDVVVNFIKKK